ncbi:pyruvate kinase [Candidatus Woesebacteria bacterium]|nr:pyruvate kinase [Candidatus Woesebacteria bacterium]
MQGTTHSKLTKIVATLGPASDSPETIEKLIQAGVNVFRFNFKHGEIEWHRERVKRVRAAAAKLRVAIGVMMDLQGPSFRIILDEPQKEIHVGDRFEFGSPVFTLTHPHIIASLQKGQKLLFDDGTITFEVDEDVTPGAQTVWIKSCSDAVLKTRKSLNIPGADFPIEILTARDYVGIDIAVEEQMEIVAFSFSRTAQDIIDVRKKLADKNCHAQICAKLETAQSMDNLEEIVKETDSVMVARGDLGVETPIQNVPVHQKRMIDTCLRYGKSVITATQMMASMEFNSFPTRAEVSDVANAVFDRTDAIMLSGESASGKYPVETVQMMTKIAQVAEFQGTKYMRDAIDLILLDDSSRVAHVAYKLYIDNCHAGKEIAAFVTFTHSGRTARLLSHFRPHIPVFAFTTSPLVYGSLCLSYAVTPFFPQNILSGAVGREHALHAVSRLKEEGNLSSGQMVIVVHGDTWGAAGGTSTVRMIQVD